MHVESFAHPLWCWLIRLRRFSAGWILQEKISRRHERRYEGIDEAYRSVDAVPQVNSHDTASKNRHSSFGNMKITIRQGSRKTPTSYKLTKENPTFCLNYLHVLTAKFSRWAKCELSHHKIGGHVAKSSSFPKKNTGGPSTKNWHLASLKKQPIYIHHQQTSRSRPDWSFLRGLQP